MHLCQRTAVPATQQTSPDAAWTTDRCGRLLAGGSIGLCLGAAWLCGTGLTATLCAAGALAIALEQVFTALIGWCPFHQFMRWLGIKEREEVYAETIAMRSGR